MKLKHILPVTALLGLFPATQLFAAGITLSLTPVTAAPGSTGDYFDVDLTNNGPAAVDIGVFDFELTSPSTAITFTGATTGTAATYIFAGNSQFGPNLVTGANSQTINPNDLFDVNNTGETVGVGTTVGLGRVFFNVAAGATPGVVTLAWGGVPYTGLSDPLGNEIAIGTLGTAQITIGTTTAVTTPEPSEFMLLSLGAGLVVCGYRRRMKS